ncbi:MAG: hypothetical protein K6A15_07155 [Treponema sp.]|nr:hypothetical protein [Treponema sp.]
MKILKFLFLGLVLVFVSCGTTQVVSTQGVNSESAAPEDLSVLKTSDLSINIDAVDGKELPVNTHSVKVTAGEHEITLSYHNVGGTNAITALMNLNATLLNQPKTQKVVILPNRKYSIRYSLNALSSEVKYSFIPEPAGESDYLLTYIKTSLKEVKRPEGYKASIDIYDELPVDKNFEILGYVKCTLNTHGARVKKVSVEEMVYILEGAMKEQNIEFDAIGYKTMQTGSFPMWHMDLEALALKYTE